MLHISKVNRISVQSRARVRKVSHEEAQKLLAAFYGAHPPSEGVKAPVIEEEIPVELIDLAPEDYISKHAQLRVQFMTAAKPEEANVYEVLLNWLGARIAR